ncbi:MAG TPA: hypothetical protein VN911_10065 [Candidatus Acidoferrum sp.]|nr:hypothetical protein [Candidatus Acidoferrum sp.]
MFALERGHAQGGRGRPPLHEFLEREEFVAGLAERGVSFWQSRVWVHPVY